MRTKKVVWCLFCVALVFAVTFTQPCWADETADTAKPQMRTVLVVEGKEVIKAKVGQIVRLQASGPSGMVQIDAAAAGPVKVVCENDVLHFRNGKMAIGAAVKEFEVRATGKGPATVKITVKNNIHKTSDSVEYRIDVE